MQESQIYLRGLDFRLCVYVSLNVVKNVEHIKNVGVADSHNYAKIPTAAGGFQKPP